jgi:hypothetical protein
MAGMLYLICQGKAKTFRPRDDEEYHHLSNEAAIKLFDKIKRGKFKFKPTCLGGSPIFNLVTTAVGRLLCSHKNSIKRRKINHSKYVRKIVQEQAPEFLPCLVDIYRNNNES